MKYSIHTKTTEKGVKITSIQVEDANVVELKMYFKAGFKYFHASEHHVPHMLEHLILGQNHETEETQHLFHIIQRLGVTINAHTDNDYIVIELSTPVSTALEAISNILHVVANPRLDGDVFESERQIILREAYERYDGIASIMGAQLFSQLLSPVFPEDPDQEIQSISDLTPDMIREAFTKTIHTGNLQVIISGAVTHVFENKLAKLLDEYIPSYSNTNKPLEDLVLLADKPSINIGQDGGIQNATCFLTVMCQNDNLLTLKDRTSNSTAFNMLFSTIDAIIPNTLRRLGYVYSVSCDQINYDDTFIFSFSITANSDKLPYAIIEFFSLIRRYSISPFPADELESIVLYARNMLPIINQTPHDLFNWYESGILANRKLTDVSSELRRLNMLTEIDISTSIQKNLVNAIWHCCIISPDANAWGNELFATLNASETQEMDEKSLRDTLGVVMLGMSSRREIIALKRRVKIFHVITTILEYLTLLVYIFIPVFPISSGDHHATTLLHEAIYTNKHWLFISPFLSALLSGLISSMTNLKYSKWIKTLLIVITAGGLWTYLYMNGVTGNSTSDDFWSVVFEYICVFYPMLIVTDVMFRVRLWFLEHLARSQGNKGRSRTGINS